MDGCTRRPKSTNKGFNFSGPILQKNSEILKLPKYESISWPGAKESHRKAVKYVIRLLKYLTLPLVMSLNICIIRAIGPWRPQTSQRKAQSRESHTSLVLHIWKRAISSLPTTCRIQ